MGDILWSQFCIVFYVGLNTNSRSVGGNSMSNRKLNEVASSQAPGMGHCYDPYQPLLNKNEKRPRKKTRLFPMFKSVFECLFGRD